MNRKIKIILILMAVIVAIVGFAFGIHKLDYLLDDRIVPEKSIGDRTILCIDGEDYITRDNIASYLIMGTDCTQVGDGDKQGDQGSMADFLLLMVVDKTSRQYGFVQINRDTIANVYNMQSDSDGEYGAMVQICVAHTYGETAEDGCNNTVKSVSELMGNLPISGYYSLNMADIGELNNLIGGVEVTVKDDFSNSDPSLVMGETILLNDSQAESYVRGRMGVGDGKNTSRMARQKEYMNGFLDKAHARVEEDASFINDLYQGLKDAAVTDLSGKSLSNIANDVRNYESLDIINIDGELTSGQSLGDGLNHAEFNADPQSIVDILKRLINIEEY